MGEEGDHVVLGLALDLVDPRDVEGGVVRLGPDRPGGIFRDHAKLGEGVRRVRLDLEPDLEARLRLPDRGHFRAGITGDHRSLRASRAGIIEAFRPIVFTPRFSRASRGRQTTGMERPSPSPVLREYTKSPNID